MRTHLEIRGKWAVVATCHAAIGPPPNGVDVAVAAWSKADNLTGDI
jgi:hypothetical protein